MMNNQELIKTLNSAAEPVKDNVALHTLLILAAERINKLDQKVADMDWQINPEMM